MTLGQSPLHTCSADKDLDRSFNLFFFLIFSTLAAASKWHKKFSMQPFYNVI